MRPFAFLSTFLLLGSTGMAAAEDKPATPYPAMAPIEQYRIAETQAEVALARSAAPPSVSADAEVLVLGKSGYEVAVKGKNQFVCFVERSWAAGFDDPEFWNPKLRSPNCFNPPAVRSVLPQYIERTKWVMAGLTKSQMADKARSAFDGHQFTEPEVGSFSFMLSKDGYLSDDAAGPWLPHVMFFVPHGQGALWGAGLEGSPVFGAEGSPFEPTVLYIPVRRWSDGSPGPAPTPHQHK
jgi:hypothetical protein